MIIPKFIDDFARWTNLRSVGNSAPAKLTVIIPLVGYLIIFNEKLASYLELSHELFGVERLPQLPVRLLLKYLGLCLIAGGSIIFSIYCLLEIKKYRSTTEYIGGELENEYRRNLGTCR